ncbi:Peptide deformylase [hydrothermal vent metagenome]|uniref:Peptide deformylase n=1 Tax=hydrothermal vent metagenome TaxID=652676 RepID=A0A3B0WYN5_9ZZZZ
MEILIYPDQRLKQLSESIDSIDKELEDFIRMLEQARLEGPGAVGIAAPQINMFKRVVIVDVSNTRKPVDNHGHMIMINPEITEWEGMAVGREGCLSVPDFTGNVIRAEKIKLHYMDEMGKSHEIESSGFEARAIQHEMDHLDGLLFLDRLVSKRNDLFARKKTKK